MVAPTLEDKGLPQEIKLDNFIQNEFFKISKL